MFKLRKPCSGCPFRKDCLKGWLGKARAEELVEEIIEGDGFFSCHKTVTYDGEWDEEVEAPLEECNQFCAGALILAQKVGENANRNIRLALRLGLFTMEEMRGGELIFDTSEEFINHHSNE